MCLWQQFELPAHKMCVHGNDHSEFATDAPLLTEDAWGDVRAGSV